ncbi:MLP1_8 [Sanghuangporus sanghuang]
MPPRRRSKKNPEADADNASARSTPPPTGSFTIGPLLQDIDLQALSNFFPDAHLEAPSAVLVVQCYRLILNQAQQLDEKERIIEAQEAEAERKEIELDQALQDRENLLVELDVNVKDVRDELTKVKAEKEEIVTSRDALKADLERISSSRSSSSHEVAGLKGKIEEVEKEKRNLLGVVSRLQEDVAERDQEINNLRESLKVTRKEAQELESTSRDIRASERSTAFKVETLTHQLQLVKDENERANAELTKKTEEYSTYRRDKHTELVQLQAELDAVKQSYNQTLTNFRTLQTSHNKQNQQLSQSLQKVQDLQNQLADQEAKYSSEAANLRRLIQMLEERENQTKELVAGIEKDWEGLGQKAAENEQKLHEALEAEQQRTKELEEELEELRSVLNRINSGELPIPSAAQASPNVSADSLFNFSPNISMINRMQKSGKTFTEVYAEYVRMQGELAKKQRDMENLDRTLGGVLAELEEATPALAPNWVRHSQRLTRGLNSSMSDIAWLRNKKKIWENVQTRLIDENKILSLERSRMADLIANVQKMHNDIDKANGSDRRRFESQIHNLEGQAQDLRTQLSRERDTVRQISLQKDIEVQELRTKVDRSVENLSKARESLVEADTSRKHLQERVDELVKQVQMNEEKIAVYERRTSSVTVTTGDASRPPAGEDSSEQELKVEVAELRAALKAAEVDLAAARSHVQQFQEISQASEAALQSLSATHDEYKASTEAQIAKVEAERKALEEKISSLQDEITRLNTKNGELQQTLEKERETYTQDKKMLEDTIVDITNAEMTSRTDQTSRENEIREQMERAKAAEDKYSREIVAHAESIKVVDAFKKELSEARASLREKTVQAETAQANLTASEASWNQQREVLNKEIADLTARCKDLAAQNSLLHQHLESVSSQASRIRQAADSNMTVPESGDGDDVDGRVVELRSVVAYLRKEKEIVDLQLELSKQENARQKAQIDHLSQALEETRTALSNEREEAAKAIQRLEDESRQWKERNAQLLTKYDRIDPNDVQALKDEIEDLQIDLRKAEEEKAAYTAEKDAQTKLLEDTQATLADFRTKYSSLGQESRNRLGQLNHQISKLNETVAELRKQVKELSDEKERLASQAVAATSSDSNADVESLKTQLAAAVQEKETSAKLLADETSKVAKAAADHEAALSALREERDKNEKRKIADAEKLATLTERHKQEQEQAVTAATEKLRAELQSPGADAAEITTRHARELRVLEARLTAKHEEELKAAIERTRKEAKEEAAKAGAATSLGTTQDMISKEEHEQALKAATERGRMESTTKLKLKDGMLQKAQANVKHLEAQIKAWREAGIVPTNAPTIPPGSVATPMKATAPVPVKPAPTAASSAATGHATAATGPTAKTTLGTATAHAPTAGPSTPTSATPAALPKKPMLGVATAATGDAHARGGRGGAAVRGVRGARGVAARGGTVRGGAPAAIAQAAVANAADGGVSIIGAAAKRAREETTENAAESLAKRIKPAETTAAAKPVALRRDRIATTPNPVPPS